MWYPIFVVSLWEVISSNKSCIISILPCAVTHHFSPSTLSFFSPLPPFFTPLYSLFPPQPPPVFHLPPPLSLSFSLSHHFHSPLLSLFPPPPVFTSLPLSLSPPTPTILHSPPTFSFPTPTSSHFPPTLSPSPTPIIPSKLPVYFSLWVKWSLYWSQCWVVQSWV